MRKHQHEKRPLIRPIYQAASVTHDIKDDFVIRGLVSAPLSTLHTQSGRFQAARRRCAVHAGLATTNTGAQPNVVNHTLILCPGQSQPWMPGLGETVCKSALAACTLRTLTSTRAFQRLLIFSTPSTPQPHNPTESEPEQQLQHSIRNHDEGPRFNHGHQASHLVS